MDSSPSAPSPARQRAFAALALLLGLIGALGLGELAVRLLDPPGSRPAPVAEGAWSPGMQPGEVGVTRFTEGEVTTDVPFRINAAGFRDEEHTPAKPPGSRRVAVLGDSFVAGLAVPQDELFVRHLEAALPREGGPVEALAFGTVGYGTGLEWITLKERALAYAPDVVVLAFFQNDPWDNHAGLGSQRAPYFRLAEDGSLQRLEPKQAGKKPRGGFSAWLNRSSRLYLWQKAMTRRVVDAWKYRSRSGVEALPKVYRPLVEPPIPGIDDAWTLTLALVDAIAATCAEHGARLVVMDIPLQEAVSPLRYAASAARFPALQELSMDWDRSVVRLGGHCLAKGIPYLDLRPALRRGADPAPLYFEHDGHFTVEGHRFVGQRLAAFLQAQGLP